MRSRPACGEQCQGQNHSKKETPGSSHSLSPIRLQWANEFPPGLGAGPDRSPLRHGYKGTLNRGKVAGTGSGCQHLIGVGVLASFYQGPGNSPMEVSVGNVVTEVLQCLQHRSGQQCANKTPELEPGRSPEKDDERVQPNFLPMRPGTIHASFLSAVKRPSHQSAHAKSQCMATKSIPEDHATWAIRVCQFCPVAGRETPCVFLREGGSMRKY